MSTSREPRCTDGGFHYCPNCDHTIVFPEPAAASLTALSARWREEGEGIRMDVERWRAAGEYRTAEKMRGHADALNECADDLDEIVGAKR